MLGTDRPTDAERRVLETSARFICGHCGYPVTRSSTPGGARYHYHSTDHHDRACPGDEPDPVLLVTDRVGRYRVVTA